MTNWFSGFTSTQKGVASAITLMSLAFLVGINIGSYKDLPEKVAENTTMILQHDTTFQHKGSAVRDDEILDLIQAGDAAIVSELRRTACVLRLPADALAAEVDDLCPRERVEIIY